MEGPHGCDARTKPQLPAKTADYLPGDTRGKALIGVLLRIPAIAILIMTSHGLRGKHARTRLEFACSALTVGLRHCGRAQRFSSRSNFEENLARRHKELAEVPRLSSHLLDTSLTPEQGNAPRPPEILVICTSERRVTDMPSERNGPSSTHFRLPRQNRPLGHACMPACDKLVSPIFWFKHQNQRSPSICPTAPTIPMSSIFCI